MSQRSRRPRVLVIDDDRAVQEAVRAELANRDYEVVVASSGDAALRLLDQLQPDVLVLDLMLPRISGPMVATRLDRMSPRPRLLVCSGLPEVAEVAADIGADGLLRKPFVCADLRAEIERLLTKA